VSREPIVQTHLGFAIAAIPIFTFCIEIMLRRMSELAGFALNLGVCLAWAVTATCLFVLTTRQQRPWTVLVITLLVAMTASLAAVAFHKFPDSGFDAQSYHLPSVLRLLRGWKPMVEATDLTLSNSYPSGMWTMLGGFDAIFGFESGRAIVPVLMISAMGAAWTMFRQGGDSAAKSAARSFILAANPVAVSQMFTTFADGILYELALILICSLIMMLEDFSLAAALFAGATTILLCNTKLAGIYFAALALVVVGGLLLWRYGPNWKALKDRRRQISVLAAAGLLGVGFVGWRPYVTNVLEHNSIVYPPPSELGYKPGSASQVPPNLDGAGRGQKIAALIFARTDMDGGPTQMKVPGTFGWHELRMSTDTRNGGFGPFFGAATLLGFAALGSALLAGARAPIIFNFRMEILLGLTAYGMLTTVFFAEPWWARFVPTAWMAPLAAGWLARELRPRVLLRACAIAVAALSLLNSAIAAYSAVRDGVDYANDIEEKLDRMTHDPGPVYLSRGTVWNSAIGGQHAAEDVWRRRLSDRGKFDVTIVPREQCREIEFLTVDVKRCAAP
jgi:hypothetical protein